MSFTWVDLCIVTIIMLSVIMSIVRGFTKESISLATWVLAIYTGLHFSPKLAEILDGAITTPSIRMVISFLILFLCVLILGGFINLLISQLVTKTGLTRTNRLMGSLFGFARGVLVIAVTILLAQNSSLPDDPWWKSSVLIPKFTPVAEVIGKMLPQKVHKVSHLLLE